MYLRQINLSSIYLILGILLWCSPFSKTYGQDLQGSWQLEAKSDQTKHMHLLLFTGKFFSWTIYEAETGAFIMTKGGQWQAGANALRLVYEFHTLDTSMVGQAESLKLKTKADRLSLKGPGVPKGKWVNLEKEVSSTPLTGAWLISGRRVEGEMRGINVNRPRKTMKILSGNRFQWIAYNTATKAFFGTGGGSYTATDGKYKESIGFFSRDNSRVGAELTFDFKIENGDWVHSGKSSRGNPLYEIWTKRQ